MQGKTGFHKILKEFFGEGISEFLFADYDNGQIGIR
jgi:hypothetical protein